MGRIGLLGLLAIFLGCGGADKSEQVLGQKIPLTPPAQSKVAQTTSDQQLHDLMTDVYQLEADRKYNDAIEIWNTIRQEMVRQFGPESWQALNCALAIDSDRRLEELTEKDPAAVEQLKQLELRSTAQINAGQLKPATISIDSAIELVAGSLGADSQLHLKLLMLNAQLFQKLGDTSLARDFFRQSLDTASQIYSIPHPDMDTCAFGLGITLRLLNQKDESINYFRQSRQQSASLRGANDLIYALRTHELGVALQQTGSLEEAEQMLSEAAMVRRAVVGDDHVFVADSLVNLAVVHIDQGRLSEAKSKIEAAIEIYQKSSGTEAALRDARSHLATVLVIEKDYAAAESVLRSVLQSIESQRGKLDRQYAAISYRLGMSLGFQQKFAEAEILFKHCLVVQNGQLGAAHHETQKTVRALAEVYRQTNQPALAKELLQRFAFTSAVVTDPINNQ